MKSTTRKTNKLAVAVITLSILLATVACATAADYDKEIKANRTGSTKLVVKDRAGNELEGLRVSYKLKERAFKFGFYEEPFNPATVAMMQEAGFDYSTVHLNWNQTEPKRGDYKFNTFELNYSPKGYKDFGMTVKTHGMVWFTDVKMPGFLWGTGFEEMKNVVRERTRAFVSRYAAHVDIWEVMNEPTADWANELGYTDAQLIELIKISAAEVRRLDPTAKILINHSNPAPGLFYKVRDPLAFHKKLDAAGVQYDIVGLQVYYDPTSSRWSFRPVTTNDLESMIDYYAGLGKEIHITEISWPSQPIKSSPAWNPSLQAEWVEKAFSLFFSRKEVTAITWWNATDRDAFVTKGGLITENGVAKPAYNKIKQLITQKWNTEGKGTTNSKGEIKINGFAGIYEVTLTDPATGALKVMDIEVKEGVSRKVKAKVKFQKKDKNLSKLVQKRQAQLDALVEYWESKGNAQLANIGRQGLNSVNVSSVGPAGLKSTLEQLEATLDQVAVVKTRTIKGIDMNITAGPIVEKWLYVEFYTNGVIESKQNFEGRKAKVTVRAKGSFADGAPRFVVAADTVHASKEVPLTSTNWKEYSFDMEYAAPGQHNLELRFTNDYASNSGNRNLYVDSITIAERSWDAPAN